MTNYDLSHWIGEQRSKKYTDEQIKSYLLKYGYSQEIIDQAMTFVDSHTKEELKMGVPPAAEGISIGQNHYDVMAVISLIFVFLFPLAALPLGILSLRHIKHNPYLKGKGFAITGIVVGSIVLLIILAYIAFMITVFSVNMNTLRAAVASSNTTFS